MERVSVSFRYVGGMLGHEATIKGDKGVVRGYSPESWEQAEKHAIANYKEQPAPKEIDI